MTEKIEKLLQEYEQAFDKLDTEAQAALFADSFISAGPKGSIAGNLQEFRKLAVKAGEFYKSVGQKGAKMLSVEETPVSNDYSSVKVHWGVWFEKTGDKPVEFDVTYILYNAEKPKIVMFIAHQDEEEAMKKLGLLK